MTSIEEDGPHVHEPCTRCGVAEAIVDGVCEECRTRVDVGALPHVDSSSNASGAAAAVEPHQ